MITPLIKSTIEILRFTQYTILPFTEKPSAGRMKVETDVAENAALKLNATDLFSLFTANIIKEEVVFTR